MVKKGPACPQTKARLPAILKADGLQEVDHFSRATDKVIVPLTVREILDEQIARSLA